MSLRKISETSNRVTKPYNKEKEMIRSLLDDGMFLLILAFAVLLFGGSLARLAIRILGGNPEEWTRQQEPHSRHPSTKEVQDDQE